MSPDAMLRAYAVRTPPPPTASPKVKGRKLSIRASLGRGFTFGKRERAQSPMMGMSTPTPTHMSSLSEAGMAGVGVRNVGAGVGGEEMKYGNEKEDVYGSAYGGVGRAA